MNTFEYTRKVTEEDIDALNHVNNVRYVQWIQDAAEAHWNHLASGELKDQYIWMVLSHKIDYKGQAFLDDEAVIKTYVTRSQGVTSVRVVEISRKDNGKPLVHSKTEWCLLQRKTQRPSRLTTALIELFE